MYPPEIACWNRQGFDNPGRGRGRHAVAGHSLSRRPVNSRVRYPRPRYWRGGERRPPAPRQAIGREALDAPCRCARTDAGGAATGACIIKPGEPGEALHRGSPACCAPRPAVPLRRTDAGGALGREALDCRRDGERCQDQARRGAPERRTRHSMPPTCRAPRRALPVARPAVRPRCRHGGERRRMKSGEPGEALYGEPLDAADVPLDVPRLALSWPARTGGADWDRE
jgi:hypothetical protein